MIEIIPSILVDNKSEFDKKLLAISANFEHVHLDIADGIFVPNKTIDGYPEISGMDSDMTFEVHLMVSKPENHITHWKGLSIEKIIFHAEATSAHDEVINSIKEGDMMAGIAINPDTDIDSIKDFMDQIDFVHFMTVEPGFYGSDFLPDIINKIKDFHFMYPDMPIEVDGGVNPDTALALVEAGATHLVVGSYFQKSDSMEKAIEKLDEAINSAN